MNLFNSVMAQAMQQMRQLAAIAQTKHRTGPGRETAYTVHKAIERSPRVYRFGSVPGSVRRHLARQVSNGGLI